TNRSCLDEQRSSSARSSMVRAAVVVLLSALTVVSPAQEPASWLREFLAQVPDGTAAVAAMTISADDVGKRILEAMSPSMREVVDDQLASKSNHAYAKTADLLRQLA